MKLSRLAAAGLIVGMLGGAVIGAGIALGQGGAGVGVPPFGGKQPADFDSLQGPYTANVGGAKATATQMTGTINLVTAVASTGDSLKLLLCSHPPMRQTIVNTSGTTPRVYGSGTDTIADASGTIATGIGYLQVSPTVEYICVSPSPAGVWTTH